ncbi:MAG: hypothetical protein V4526_00050 [Patescibacteria group bacterium]
MQNTTMSRPFQFRNRLSFAANHGIHSTAPTSLHKTEQTSPQVRLMRTLSVWKKFFNRKKKIKTTV